MDTTEARTGRYRIAEAAALSGFAATTLRFYEDEGILRPASRSGAGYRMYDDRDVERLRLIARAKELGCTLEEIKGLVEAWDADECGPVKHQMRDLVASKIADVERRISELTALGQQLRSTSATLAAAPVEGPCDESCGCGAPIAGAEARGCGCGGETCTPSGTPIAVGAATGGTRTSGPSCSLGGGQMAERVAQWRRLLERAVRREEIPDGVRIVFDSTSALAELAGLVAAEHECCSFFSFVLSVDTQRTTLEVTAPPEHTAVMATLFGATP